MTFGTHGDGGGTTNVVELRPRAQESASRGAAPRRASSGAGAPSLEAQLEALLFVSPVPLRLAELATITEQDEDDLHECLVDMMGHYAEGSRGIVLEPTSGGWAFRASDHCSEQLERLTSPQGDTRLSPSALETLAVVAWLQPVGRPEIARIRGVSVDAAMQGLLERGFVEESGRGESGAVLFRTTALFERAFGLSSLASLPALEGFAPGEESVARMRGQLEQMAAQRFD